jgi:hypothetical protein
LSFEAQKYQQTVQSVMMYIIKNDDINQAQPFLSRIFLATYSAYDFIKILWLRIAQCAVCGYDEQ